MDSHIKGCAVNGYGAISGQRGLRTLFGTTLAGTANQRVLLKTTGASVTTPLLIELLQIQKTAFNGTSPQVAIISTNLDGSGSANELVIADITPGQPFKSFLIYADKIYYVRYTAATGSPTAGEIFSLARVQGLGPTS